MRRTWAVLGSVALIVGVAGPAWAQPGGMGSGRNGATAHVQPLDKGGGDHGGGGDRDGGGKGGGGHDGGGKSGGGDHGHGGGGDHHEGHDRGDGDHGRHYNGGSYDYGDYYYGCGYSDCYPYYGGYDGRYGYGCNYDYPCGSDSYDRPSSSQCVKYSHSGHATYDDQKCKYDPGCDCWYPSSSPPPKKQGAGNPG